MVFTKQVRNFITSDDNVNTNNKSFILYIYFKGASITAFAACSVNNRESEVEAIITK